MIVLDTNVLSELMQPHPSAAVTAWIAHQSPMSLFTTAVTQAEILYGLALLPRGQRRTQLTRAVGDIFHEDLAGRVLSFDRAAAEVFAEIAAARRSAGRPISQFDAQIAAIALSRGAGLATRNTADFEALGLSLHDPWSS